MSATVPIYRRYVNHFTPHTLECSDGDRAQSWLRLYPDGEDPFYNSYGRLKYKGFPCVCFVGDSNIVHLSNHSAGGSFPTRVQDFLEDACYVGVGGLTWWKCKDELNGIFDSDVKLKRYGNNGKPSIS